MMNLKRIALSVLVIAVLGIGGLVGAATYSDYTSGDIQLSKSGIEPIHNYLPFIEYRKFDFGNANLNAGNGVTSADIVKLFNVQPNTFIEEFGYRVTTAAVMAGTSAVVGDGADADGFVANTYASKGIAYIDLCTVSNGISRWNIHGFYTSGATDSQLSGVSMTIGLSPPSGAGTSAFISSVNFASNHGPYFTSGLSPYVRGDTIDMTLYVDKSFNPGAGKTGVTPVFEAYIKGFKRVVP